MAINKNNLTPRYREALAAGKISHPDNDPLMLMTALNCTISYVACAHRWGYPGEPGQRVFLNYYGLALGQSGCGKSSSINYYWNLIRGIRENIKTLCKEEIEADKKLVDARKESYKARKFPAHRSKMGTLAGYLWERFLFSKTSVGCPFLTEDEFFKYIKSNTREETVEGAVLEAYDVGRTDSGANKSFTIGEIEDVPQVAIFLSAASAAINNEKVMDRFYDFLSEGQMRRSTCFFAQPKPYIPKTLEQEKELERVSVIQTEKVRKYFEELDAGISRGSQRFVSIPEDTHAFMHKVSEDLKRKASDWMLAGKDPLGQIELQQRPFKTKKLAGAIALFEHPNDHSVHIEDYKCALEITTGANDSFHLFFQRSGGREITERLYSFIKENAPVARSKFWGIRGIRRDKDPQVLERELVELSRYCEEFGEMLQEEDPKGKQRGRKTILYKIVPMPIAENIPLTVPKTENYKLVCATSYKQGFDFANLELPISEICSIMQTETPNKEITSGKGLLVYVAAHFKNGEKGQGNRRGENWTGRKNAIILDVDNETGKALTIDEFKEKTKGLAAIIQPTRSHLVEKKGRTVDRFRVIFPTPEFVGADTAQHNQIVRNFAKHYGLLPHIDIGASEDAVHYYFPSGHKPEIQKGDFVNWRAFLQKPEQPPQKTPAFIPKKAKRETLEDGTIVIRCGISGKKPNVRADLAAVFAQCRSLGQTEKKQMRCPLPGHEDKNPSAYVQRHKDNGKLMFRCSSCMGNELDKNGNKFFYFED
jgi:hypothetical protein